MNIWWNFCYRFLPLNLNYILFWMRLVFVVFLWTRHSSLLLLLFYRLTRMPFRCLFSCIFIILLHLLSLTNNTILLKIVKLLTIIIWYGIFLSCCNFMFFYLIATFVCSALMGLFNRWFQKLMIIRALYIWQFHTLCFDIQVMI